MTVRNDRRVATNARNGHEELSGMVTNKVSMAMTTREHTVTTRERAVTTREHTVLTREHTMITRERTMITRERAVITLSLIHI